MAESVDAAAARPAVPTSKQLERAREFTREPFVLEGEGPAEALAPGTGRRRALDAALDELDAGARKPSTAWRRRYSLLIGLERTLWTDEPKLADGTVLSAHQVDALSGTLIALLTEAERNGNGSANGNDASTAEGRAEAPSSNGRRAQSDDGGDDDVEAVIAEEEGDSDEDPIDWAEAGVLDDDVDDAGEPIDDPNAAKRFWFEHATGAGKTVAALGFVEASRTGGVLILTHRRNLVDQFLGELRERGYRDRISAPLLDDKHDPANGPVTVETYQWFVRNAGRISDAYTIVICDEAHTALGEKTSACIRAWTGPVFVGMTATGALIARHVADLFPTQTSRFDLAQAARRGVIAPLRCVRIPPGPGVRTIAKVPLRKGDIDVEFDQEMLAELLDQMPFNVAIADLYKTRFNGVPGVVYTAGVRHAYNVAQAFRDAGLAAQAVSGETPKRELAQILSAYEAGQIDVLVNAQLLAEGWNSPRATVCMHLAPTASKRIYQQRVGRVTRRHQGKEAGIVVDFVHPATRHDDPVVTLHSLLDRDVYRGGAIVVGPVRRGRGRRLRVERRVLPVTADESRRHEVFERELWRIAVEHLDWGEQHMWAALAGARVVPTSWRRARAMLHFDSSGELKRRFLVTAMQRNRNSQLRLRALQEVAGAKDADAIDAAVDIVGGWSRDEKREGVKILLNALADKRVGRRDQANNWIWRCAEYSREVHEEYAVQRWPETKRLLGLLVNSSGAAHARNARRLVHAARQQDRRLSAAILAAALAHTPEAGEVINGARMRMSRKPGALARELLRNFPKGKSRSRRRRKKSKAAGVPEAAGVESSEALVEGAVGESGGAGHASGQGEVAAALRASAARGDDADTGGVLAGPPALRPSPPEDGASDDDAPKRRSRRRRAAAKDADPDAAPADAEAPKRSSRRRKAATEADGDPQAAESETPQRSSRRRRATAPASDTDAQAVKADTEAPKRSSRRRKPAADADASGAEAEVESPDSASRPRTAAADASAGEAGPDAQGGDEQPKRASRRRTPAAKATAEPADEAEAPRTTTRRRKAATTDSDADAAEPEAPKRSSRRSTVADGDAQAGDEPGDGQPKRASRRRTTTANASGKAADEADAPRTTTRRRKPASGDTDADTPEAEKPKRAPRRRTTAAESAEDEPAADEAAPKRSSRRKPAAAEGEAEDAGKPKRTTTRRKAA